jgi:MFS family permease
VTSRTPSRSRPREAFHIVTENPQLYRRLCAVGVLLGYVAEQIVLFAVPLLIFQSSQNVSSLGLAYGIEWAPALLAYPFAGLLADRDGGARLFRVVAAGRAAVLVADLIGCLTFPSLVTPILMTSGALISLLMAPGRMAVEKVVRYLADGAELAKLQGLVQSMQVAAMAVGPSLALLGAVFISKVWLLGGAAVIFLAAAACWLRLPRGLVTPARGGAKETLADLRLGWTLLARSRPLVLLTSMNFSINLVFATVLSANAAFVTGVFHAPQSAFALLNILIGVLGLVNLLAVPFVLKRLDVGMIGGLGLAILCFCLLSIGFAHSISLYGVEFVAAMLGVTYYNVFNRTQRVKVLPPEHLGKAMGPFYLLSMLANPVAGLLVASVGSDSGLQRLVAVLAMALTVYGAVTLPLTVRAVRRALVVREEVLPTANTESVAQSG